MTIEEFNRLGESAAASALAACVEIDTWVNQVLAGRPYHSRDGLLAHAAKAAQGWSPAQVDGALAHHPRIGERPRAEAIGAANAAHSAGEQSGVNGAATATKEALASGNAAYEKRFGRVFLIRAAGRRPTTCWPRSPSAWPTTTPPRSRWSPASCARSPCCGSVRR